MEFQVFDNIGPAARLKENRLIILYTADVTQTNDSNTKKFSLALICLLYFIITVSEGNATYTSNNMLWKNPNIAEYFETIIC